jgi:general secretion pathway protein G
MNRPGPARRTQRGFTLIELLVAIAILGILGTVVIKAVAVYIDEARQTGTKTKVDIVHAQVESYRRKHNDLPRDLEDLLQADPMNNNLPYLDNVDDIYDAWSHKMDLVRGERTGQFEVVSYGANGTPDGYGFEHGLERDISSTRPLNPVEAR